MEFPEHFSLVSFFWLMLFCWDRIYNLIPHRVYSENEKMTPSLEASLICSMCNVNKYAVPDTKKISVVSIQWINRVSWVTAVSVGIPKAAELPYSNMYLGQELRCQCCPSAPVKYSAHLSQVWQKELLRTLHIKIPVSFHCRWWDLGVKKTMRSVSNRH